MFPGVFRGLLDVRARAMTDAMAIAGAQALAAYGEKQKLADDCILPPMSDPDVAAHVAVAVGLEAQRHGIAQLSRSAPELLADARQRIDDARRATTLLMREGLIAERPAAP